MQKGIIGKKIGMTQVFDEKGKVIPVTVIEAGPCVVAQKKTVENDGYAAVQLAGFITVAAGEDVTEGWCALAADGSGGVKVDAGQTGGTYLVAEAADGSAAVLL